MAIALTEKEGFKARFNQKTSEYSITQTIKAIAVNYEASFLLTTTLAYKLGQGDLQAGYVEIVERLYDYAQEINAGNKPILPDYAQLLYIIDPTLTDDTEIKKTEKLMLEIKGRLLSGKLQL